MCAKLSELKADSEIHFKSLSAATNNCHATFYVTEEKVADTLAQLQDFRNVEITRDTSSVTRHKQQLESQTVIIQQQLSRTESTLAAAEQQLAQLNALFATSDEVTKLSAEVTNSLRYIDQLTQRKINYLSQLDDLYQQAADLNERISVVQFDVHIVRAVPIYTGKYERQWDAAWEELHEVFTDTMIGLTAFFGVFLLWAIRLTIYLLVIIVFTRGLWKFAQWLWSKW